MANIADYLTWRGDLPLSVDPWRTADSLCMSGISYLSYPEAAGPEGVPICDLKDNRPEPEVKPKHWAERNQLLSSMADSRRFGDLRVHDSVDIRDEEKTMQFAAQTYDVPDGTVFVAFRGTDNTLVGWQEDFDMSYETVPAQEAAAAYLRDIALRYKVPIRVGGHSKGGNLAVYASAKLPEELQYRLIGIYSFDGPGLQDENIRSEGYIRVADRIHHLIPESSIVGKLMNYNPNYTVVASDARGFGQHDFFSWQLTGPDFQVLPATSRSSDIMDATLHKWLEASTPEERHDFVTAVFEMLKESDMSTLAEMNEGKVRATTGVLNALRKATPTTRKMMGKLLGRFVSIGTSTTLDSFLPDTLKEMRTLDEFRSLIQSRVRGDGDKAEAQDEAPDETFEEADIPETEPAESEASEAGTAPEAEL